jgi:hypothetical protein
MREMKPDVSPCVGGARANRRETVLLSCRLGWQLLEKGKRVAGADAI